MPVWPFTDDEADAAAVGTSTCCGTAVLAVTTLPYSLQSRDIALPAELRPPFDWGEICRGFWVSPRRYPDFGWAWFTRFLMNLGNAFLILYLLYYLTDAVGLSDDDAATGVFRLTVVCRAVTVVTAIAGGWWSDRVGRRKVFVIWSGMITAAALLLFALVPTMAAAYAAAIVLGIGSGAYQGVDFAMIGQVLPAARDRGKDLGVINIANALPQVLAPVVAAGVLAVRLGYRGAAHPGGRRQRARVGARGADQVAGLTSRERGRSTQGRRAADAKPWSRWITGVLWDKQRADRSSGLSDALDLVTAPIAVPAQRAVAHGHRPGPAPRVDDVDGPLG